MAILIIVGLVAILVYALYEFRRVKWLHFLERTERLHMRFSDLRHRLVLLAGSGQLSRDDQKAFKFLYTAITYLLRHPSLYQRIGTAYWIALRTAAPASGGNQGSLTKKDFSESIYPLLKEYVESTMELTNEFARPAPRMILLAALLSQRRISEWYKNAGRWLQEFKTERKLSEAWASLSSTLL